MKSDYQPFHLKYRPQSFDELIGQEPIAETLKQAINTNRIAPAYLFSGPRGTGKTSSARILARSLNCLGNEKPTIKPCGECNLCKSIANATSLDVIEIDAASNTGVDNIREIIERSRFAPVQARWKVYVIDECHMLSTAAFNALLKTLEEPPLKVVFILATTDPQRVLPTILSRCQRFDFRQIAQNPLQSHLELIAKKENIDIQSEAIQLIAQKAQGGLRDAESMLDQLSLLPQPINKQMIWEILGAVPENELLNLVQALEKSDPLKLIETSRILLDQGREPLGILQGVASMLRDLSLIYFAPSRPELSSFSNNIYNSLVSLSQEIGYERLYSWQASLKGSENQLRQSSQPRLWLEVLLIGLLGHSEKKVDNVQEHTLKETNDIQEINVREEMAAPSKKVISKEKEEKVDNKIDLEKDLSDIWKEILQNLELPSTKMLLSQQAELIQLTQNSALIYVSSNWHRMVESRLILIEDAIKQTLGREVKAILKENKEKATSSKLSSEKKAITSPQTSKKKYISNEKEVEESKMKDAAKVFNKKQEEVSLADGNDNIGSSAKNLANFFNGKVIDVDE